MPPELPPQQPMPPQMPQGQPMPPQMPPMPPEMPEMPMEEPIMEQEAPEQIMPYSMSPVNDGMPYFMGDYALIQFASEDAMTSQTYWLVDKGDHTLRPFESEMALDAAFGDQLQEALQNAVTVTPPNIDSEGEITSGVLEGFTILGPEYAIKDDGSTKELDFSSYQLKNRYGKPINESLEDMAAEAMDGFLSILKDNESKTDVPSKFISGLMNDQRLMAFYISALAYGDYTLNDIYADIKRRLRNSNK